MGLVRLTPGANPQQVQQRLRRALGPSVQVMTRAEADGRDSRQWLEIRPVGLMFNSGVLIGIVVGAVTLYQVLTSEVMSRMAEYATLKALGYSNGYIKSVVYVQSALFVLFAFVPALLASFGLYAALRQFARIPITMTLQRVAFVLFVNLVLSLASCSLAIRRVRTANPAELF